MTEQDLRLQELNRIKAKAQRDLLPEEEYVAPMDHTAPEYKKFDALPIEDNTVVRRPSGEVELNEVEVPGMSKPIIDRFAPMRTIEPQVPEIKNQVLPEENIKELPTSDELERKIQVLRMLRGRNNVV